MPLLKSFEGRLAIPLSSNVLWVCFFIALITFAVSCLVYIYHWRSYGTNAAIMNRVTVFYVGIGLGLLAVSALLILIA